MTPTGYTPWHSQSHPLFGLWRPACDGGERSNPNCNPRFDPPGTTQVCTRQTSHLCSICYAKARIIWIRPGTPRDSLTWYWFVGFFHFCSVLLQIILSYTCMYPPYCKSLDHQTAWFGFDSRSYCQSWWLCWNIDHLSIAEVSFHRCIHSSWWPGSLC